jgi:Tol biopolymer transport system component
MLAALAQTQTAPFAVEDCSTAPRDYALAPDGTMLAVTCPQGVLKVISPQWTAPLSLDFADVYGREHDVSLGLLRPLAWSNDSQYLFFVPTPLTGSIARLADGAALLRLDVLNNRVSAVVGGADYRQARFAFAISPDGTTLALIDQGVSPLQLSLRGIGGSSRERQIPLNPDSNERREKYRQAGRILWSADGTRIIVGLSSEGGTSPLECEVLLVDMAQGSQPVLLEMPAAYWAPLAWLDEDTIVIEDILTGETRELDVP